MSDAVCRAAKLCAGAVPRPRLPRNRMSELFTYGSVGVAGYSHRCYGVGGEGPPLPGRRTGAAVIMAFALQRVLPSGTIEHLGGAGR